jgi:hypothetical protein
LEAEEAEARALLALAKAASLKISWIVISISCMSKDKKEAKNRPAPNAHVERAPPTVRGRERWIFSTGDGIRNLTTSNSSAVIMDEALTIYGPALKRLAKR